jgi:hypothetical protein
MKMRNVEMIYAANAQRSTSNAQRPMQRLVLNSVFSVRRSVFGVFSYMPGEQTDKSSRFVRPGYIDHLSLSL